jgi:hypothetical protein
MSADVDIDFADRDAILKHIKHIPARQQERKHNSGVYVTDIPVDPINGCSTLDYKEAEDRGYFKIDFLNVNVYSNIKDNEHYEQLLNATPPWEKLLDKNFCSKIIHISNHWNDIVKMKPDSVARMAMFLALIRPGKKHLIGKTWKEIGETIWEQTEDGYSYKKAHAVSYAKLVALHMNIIDQDL